MGTADIITVISLIIAIIAIINAKQRQLIVLKFTYVDYYFLSAMLLLITYLVFFKYFVDWGLYFRLAVHPSGLISNDWAFVFTLLTIVFISYKILFAFFPRVKREQVLKYYTELTFKSDYLFLLDLIEKYHLADIITHLADSKLKSNRMAYAREVFSDIVCRDDFIKNTANERPYFYVDMIEYLKTLTYSSLDLLTTYLNTLLRSKNDRLFSEFRNNQGFESLHRYCIPEGNRIISALMGDLQIIKTNLAWMPFGDNAIDELREEREKRHESFFNKSFSNEQMDRLWHYATYIAIWFFDIMLREAIYRREEDHLSLFYYCHFTDGIIDALKVDPINRIDEDSEFPTFNHFMIYSIIDNLVYWLRCIEDSTNDMLLDSTCRCLGRCLHSVAISGKLKYRFKKYIFAIIMTYYCKLKASSVCNKIRSALTDMFIDAAGLGIEKEKYTNVLVQVWQDFDKTHYTIHGPGNIAELFESTVIHKLLLKQDEESMP